MPRFWRRSDIELGMVVTKDRIDDPNPSAEPLLYKIVGIVDEPMVVIRPLYERDGDENEHYVISSPLFAEFHHVKAASEPGAIESIGFGADK